MASLANKLKAQMNPSSLLTAVHVSPSRGRSSDSIAEHLNICPSFLPAPLQTLHKDHPPEKHGSRALHKQLPTLHISPVNKVTFCCPKAESASSLKTCDTMWKCTQTHSVKSSERIPVRENNHSNSTTNKSATNHNRSDNSKISPWKAFTFLKNLSKIIFWHPDLLS